MKTGRLNAATFVDPVEERPGLASSSPQPIAHHGLGALALDVEGMALPRSREDRLSDTYTHGAVLDTVASYSHLLRK